MRILSFILALAITPLSLSAQIASPDLAAKSEAMSQLAFIVGEWSGSGWVRMGPERSEFFGTETVESRIDDLAIIIEGVHRSRLPDGSEPIVHNALALLTYDPASESYRFVTHLASGRSGDYFAMLIDHQTLEWSIPETPFGTMRYTITVKNDEWHETGDISKDGTEWIQFFEMTLKKIK